MLDDVAIDVVTLVGGSDGAGRKILFDNCFLYIICQ